MPFAVTLNDLLHISATLTRGDARILSAHLGEIEYEEMYELNERLHELLPEEDLWEAFEPVLRRALDKALYEPWTYRSSVGAIDAMRAEDALFLAAQALVVKKHLEPWEFRLALMPIKKFLE